MTRDDFGIMNRTKKGRRSQHILVALSRMKG
ncbi:hypothetical protein EM595_2519 [Duffyella gerundensis]|uniref:Uncharacterized protein n=1 Tax=Duffyella gerundensis TaxID=1619313 RepID=A0A0U5L2P3_9GAMM|nr:hypothetical protein EM595_2519 [Duffyella gerundensis]